VVDALEAVTHGEGLWALHAGDALSVLRTLPSESVHCVVTSPPYWGLRDYGVEGQLGVERTPEEYIARVVTILHEARRVLRAEGTLWLNLGDSYANDTKWGGATSGKHRRAVHAQEVGRGKRDTGLKAKELVGIPWRTALALREDGWCLRSEIIWSKPSVMPESVRDRPTRSHEHVFLLARGPRYFFDAYAVREPCASLDPKHPSYRPSAVAISEKGRREFAGKHRSARSYDAAGRNIRTVWTIATRPFKGAHFATFPPKLVELAILAGTSERGCCATCGAPWTRRVARERRLDGEPTRGLGAFRSSDRAAPDTAQGVGHWRIGTAVTSVGWQRGCACESEATVPCTVLDPFAGSGTTGLVALERGRRFVGIDLNPEYVVMAGDRLQGAKIAGAITP